MRADGRDGGWRFRIDARVRRRLSHRGEVARLAEMFGLGDGRTEVLYDGFELTIRPGEIVAVVGPSGAGKSVLLREVAKRAARRKDIICLDVGSLEACELPAISAVGEQVSLRRRLAVLSRCGLAEAMTLVAPARHLSGGQLYRLALARAILQAEAIGGKALLIADEFAAALDRDTAIVLCRQVRRLASGRAASGSRHGIAALAALIATPRAELLVALAPDRVISKPLGGEAKEITDAWWQEPRGDGRRSDWRIERGSIADYRPLARFHYLAGKPAAHKRVWVVRRREEALPGDVTTAFGSAGSPAAVLVVSPPVRNCRGRNAAMPGRYTNGSKRRALMRLNAEIECISRVVVHPIFRGLGLGVGLVRHALATAETSMVEALAAMGEVHPLFEKAGMYSFGAFVGGRRYFYYLGRRMPYVVRLPRGRRGSDLKLKRPAGR